MVPIIPGKGVLYGGGIEAQVYGLAKALTKLCDDVHLITVQAEVHSNENTDEIIYHKISLQSKVPASKSILELAYSDLVFAYKSKHLCSTLDVDLIHCNTKFPAVAALLRPKRQPVVFTAHNWKLWEGMKPEWKNSFASTVFKLDVRLEKFIAHKSERILAVSEAMRRGIVGSTRISSRKVDVVSNAVDPDVFYPETTNRTRSILYVGRITAEKGIDTLIRAIPLVRKEASDARLVIVGPKKYGLERGGYEEYLRHVVKKLRIEQHVTFAGTLSVNDLRKAYSQASVFCLPAVWQEPFGLTLIEAMACQTPVIGTSVGGIPEIISESKSGLLVKPNHIEELAEAIIRILSDTNFARRLGRNGRKAVTEKYTFARLAQQVYSVYLNLIESI